MFAALFSESGLSLDRLRALVEVGAAGSIARASGGDPVRQSQYSRQIKELENFFQTRLTERHGKGSRLTPSGRELTRISRFFLLGLSKFQQGCLSRESGYRMGAPPTFIQCVLLPALLESSEFEAGRRCALEVAGDEEIERRLHDLTLDFGIVSVPVLSRPLRMVALGGWRLKLWVPLSLCRTPALARKAFQAGKLPLVVPPPEFAFWKDAPGMGSDAGLRCTSFLEARTALESGKVAAFLPDFLGVRTDAKAYFHLPIPRIDSIVHQHRLAWNPRLLRLNPEADRVRETLCRLLATALQDLHTPAPREGGARPG